MIELLLFASTFVAVFALGLQSLNVNNGHYLAAFITSFLIGGSQLWLYRLLPEANLLQVAAYLAGGPFGIVFSMWFHQRTIGRNAGRNAARKARPRTP
jgi:hypothetical protein